jgi:hypothetical protein
MANDDRQDQATSADSQNDGPSPSEEFRQDQTDAAADQALTDEGAVPESRPAAFDRIEDYHQSPTYLALREQGSPLVDNTPMPKSAYDRANSKKQRSAAAKEERVPQLHVAEPVKVNVSDPDNPNHIYNGRYGAIERVNYKDLEAERTVAAGNSESRFAEVETYTVRLRDERRDLLEFTPEELQQAAGKQVQKAVV